MPVIKIQSFDMHRFVIVCTILAISSADTTKDFSKPLAENAEFPYRCTGRNEIYTRCGSACPETCDSILIPNRACIALCVPGCFCKLGFVRNRWNICIPKQKCPCKNFYETYKCGNCQGTCKTLYKSCEMNNSTHQNCEDGCYCINGYVRNDEDVCIPVEQCPVKTLKDTLSTTTTTNKPVNDSN